jgi:hypothetical protein
VTTDTETLEAVRKWPQTTDKHQLRSFLGLCTYYKKFIHGYADIAKPLTRLTEEKRMFEWSTESEIAFGALKEALCSAPVLGYSQAGEKFIIDTYASNVGVWWSTVASTRWQRKGRGLLQQNFVQGREKLLCDSSEIVSCGEDPRTFSQIFIWTRIPPT